MERQYGGAIGNNMDKDNKGQRLICCVSLVSTRKEAC